MEGMALNIHLLLQVEVVVELLLLAVALRLIQPPVFQVMVELGQPRLLLDPQ